MTKSFFTIVCLTLSFYMHSQTQLFENPNFDEIVKDHKIIGIVPFKTTITLRPKQMKDLSPEQLSKMERAEGESIQSALYSWFLKREKRGDMSVMVQDPTSTNVKLKKAGVTQETFEDYTPAELAQIMEVDSIILGTFETNKPMSEGASIALGALLGVFGSTNNAVLNLFIYNAQDGELLVNYNKSVSGSIGSSTDDLINMLMRKASRRIAYAKN